MMSEQYTHKIILFTENNFGGDALVIIRNVNENESISLNQFTYRPSYEYIETNFDEKVNSFIVDKGIWILGDSTYRIERAPGEYRDIKIEGRIALKMVQAANENMAPKPPSV